MVKKNRIKVTLHVMKTQSSRGTAWQTGLVPTAQET